MGILDDIAALGRDATNPAAAADVIRSLQLSPAGRAKLVQEWQQATGQIFPEALLHDLGAG